MNKGYIKLSLILGTVLGLVTLGGFLFSAKVSQATSQQTTICHCTPEGCNTLDVSEEALAGHFDAQGNPLHEGDYLGACSVDEEPTTPWVHVNKDCGGGLTFHNPTDWLFVFDVRVDDEAYLDDGTGDPWYGLEIHEGALKGQHFGARWREVVVDGRADQHEAFLPWSDMFGEDTGTHKVEYRLAEGAEQQMYFDWVTVREIESNCEADLTPTPEQPRGTTEASAPQEPACKDLGVYSPTITEVSRVDSDTVRACWTKPSDNADSYLIWYGSSEDNLPYNTITKDLCVDINGMTGTTWLKVAAKSEGCTGNFSETVDP